MLLVDLAGNLLELLPNRFAKILGYRAYLLPLLMEFLELLECVHNIRHLNEALGLVNNGPLALEVLLEIEVSEFVVYLYVVVELLNCSLVLFPEVFNLGCWNLANALPTGLELLEGWNCEVKVLGLV